MFVFYDELRVTILWEEHRLRRRAARGRERIKRLSSYVLELEEGHGSPILAHALAVSRTIVAAEERLVRMYNECASQLAANADLLMDFVGVVLHE